MQAKHYLGVAALLVILAACYQLFSRNLIEATREATTEAVATEFGDERSRSDIRRDREHEDLVRQTRQAAAAAVSEQFKKERELNEARARAVRQQYTLAAHLSEGFAIASNARMLVSQHYMTTNEFPRSNHELGLPPAREFSGVAVDSLEVSWGGVITISYNQKVGKNRGEIVLRPSAGRAMGLQWKCETDSFATIEALLPQCRYTG